MEASYDYVVIGGGSSGCIVAARLAEAGASSVLLLEAGDAAQAHPETLTADGFKYAFANDALMWHRMSTKQSHCGDRSLYLGTGRGMGGSGAVNGMVYTRGDKRDFDHWPQGWRWNDLEPAFTAVEQQLGIRPRPPTAFARAFIQAAEGIGLKRKDGMNDGELGGVVGCNDMNYAGDARRSSYRSWLHDAQHPNLKVLTDATVQRLIFAQGKRCTAVDCRVAGLEQRIKVGQEVVLCAGALETPKLLLLSGVGPRAELEALGIAVVQDAPGVGKQLHDHPNVCLFYRSQAKVDFHYPQIYAFDAAGRDAGDTSAPAPDTCFVCYAAPASLQQSMQRMLPILALPGRWYALAPLRKLLRGLVNLVFKLPPVKRYVAGVFGIVVILGKPTARGEITLASKSPDVPANINPAYYGNAQDRQTMLAAVHKARRIATQPVLQAAGVKALSAGAKTSNPEKIWRWITAATMTTFHFCGSCRMGADADSPLDTELRVKGLANVRVADASVIPETPVSALNAPSMMIAYRAADFILAAQADRQAA